MERTDVRELDAQVQDVATEQVPEGVPTPDAITTYLPEQEPRRRGVALCLSGGGFRAALFHLGALRRLNELGVLSQVDTVSSVSGGSIFAAHLAQRIRSWPQPGTVIPARDWEAGVSAPFRNFVSKNLRTGPLARRLLPWNWRRSSAAVEALAAQYERRLVRLRLSDLPQRPRFTFCATDLAFGVNWVFERDRVGDYQAGYRRPAPDWPVARAVAASSCFPPVFDPLPVGLRPNELQGGQARGKERDTLVSALSLTDGGVYDNMGLEPVWKTARIVLVSDGGAPFDFEPGSNVFTRLLRYQTVISNQAGSVRKRWLIASFITKVMDGTYWGIGSAAADYENPAGYSTPLVETVIGEVRTDLDAFSEPEIKVLENHGYLLANAAIQRHAPELIRVDDAPLQIPHEDWMDEERVARALADSRKRKLAGRR